MANPPREKFRLARVPGESHNDETELAIEAAADPDSEDVEAAAVVEPTAGIENAAQLGKLLAAQLDEQGYHPVVIFGSSASGKSSLLGSLLAYLQQDGAANIELQLGQPLISDDQAYGRFAHEEAKTFFHRSVQEFIHGAAHAATMSPNPFFIPVILRPHGALPEVRIAFLESRGDWYNPDAESNEFFRRLRGEISGVLLHYQKGISFLHIAPYSQVPWDESATAQRSRDAELRKIADQALVGCFNSYRDLRVVKHQDTHMFLVTKWDIFARPGAEDGNFSHPAEETVREIATERYPLGYAAFLNLTLGGASRWQKQVMQYCSGLISGRDISRATGELRPEIYRYPRVLWDWLYQNASRQMGEAVHLFPKPPEPAPTLLSRMSAILGRFLRLIGV